MRDLVQTQIRLSDALAIFPDFTALRFDDDGFWPEHIVVTDAENVQEIIIFGHGVRFWAENEQDFNATDTWFAVTAIVFAVLSGRE